MMCILVLLLLCQTTTAYASQWTTSIALPDDTKYYTTPSDSVFPPSPCSSGRVAPHASSDDLIGELLDEQSYRIRYPDVDNAIRTCVYRSGLDHFVIYGMREGRESNLWFNEAYYLASNSDVAEAVRGGAYISGYDHYVRYGMREGRKPSGWFDEAYYLASNSDVAQAVRNGAYLSGSHHFALWGLRERRNPPSWFDDTLYLKKYPDVAGAVAAGALRSGFEHYVLYGRPEGRKSEALSAAAVQTAYRAGVPHTDEQGNLRSAYSLSSFFPRCIYHAIKGSFQVLKHAGFNCVHTWEGLGIADVIDELRSVGLQLLKHWPTDAEVRSFSSDPNILGWYLDEEPSGRDLGNTALMNRRYQAFLSRRLQIKALDPHHPVFPLDNNWIPPGHHDWWVRWNTAGDLTSHDNYPLLSGATDYEALANSVQLAVRLNSERKPMWLTVQAFKGSADMHASWSMPTIDDLRGMVFTAIIHGATGIIYFAYDSKVTRAGQVIGMAPDTPESYGSYAAATPVEVSQSRALWAAVPTLNAELARLTSRILSPTADVLYTVYFAGESKTRSPIRTMLKVKDGVYTLFAANIEKTSLGARFQFPQTITSVKRLNTDGSTTTLTPNGQKFSDSIGPFGAAVYEMVF